MCIVQCSETDFLIRDFFVAIFSFWDTIDFVLNIRSEFVWDLDFCKPDSETLTSNTR